MSSAKPMNELLIDHKQSHPLSSIIYTKVVEQILQGDFGPSGKLPAENDLAIQFNVSRSTIREALSRLRADGVIESRRKAGTFVIRNPGSGPLTHVPIKNFGDIEKYYSFRSCIESGAAASAAINHEEADILDLEKALLALNATMQEGHSGIDEDVTFHLAIAKCSHNTFFVRTIETSVAPIRQFIELVRNIDDKKSPARVLATQKEHRAIVDAIIKRSPSEASEAVIQHISNAKNRIFEGTTIA
jgi:DNA-binding FadR family transcriptional regulator